MTLKIVKPFTIRKNSQVIVVLLITVSILAPVINAYYTDPETNQHDPITMVTASRNYPSFNPKPFFSGSGKLHLLFQHVFVESDAETRHYYHTYELENGSWVLPKKVFTSLYTIFDIKPSENGFAIYYRNNGLSKKEYNEQTNMWLDPVVIFGTNQIRDYVDSSGQEISWSVYSFFLLENGSFFVVWSFCFQDGSDSTHEDEQSYIVSKVDPNGSIFSQPIDGLKRRCSLQLLTLVKYNDHFFLYDPDYKHRAVYFSNGTWSRWQEIIIAKNYTSCNRKILVTNRFVVCYTKKIISQALAPIWIMLDLASEILTIKELNLPHNPDDSLYNYDFEFKISSGSGLLFVTALVINGTVELWEFNYLNNTWNQVASHDYGITRSITAKLPILMQKEALLRLFWDQRIVTRPYEIFTAFYNTITEEWSPVTQVTYSDMITDDYTEPVQSFSFIIVLIGLLITVIFFKKAL